MGLGSVLRDPGTSARVLGLALMNPSLGPRDLSMGTNNSDS